MAGKVTKFRVRDAECIPDRDINKKKAEAQVRLLRTLKQGR